MQVIRADGKRAVGEEWKGWGRGWWCGERMRIWRDMEIIAESHYDYTFYRENGNLFLSVTCGTTAVFDVTIELKPHEVSEYEKKGTSYIIYLADQVRYDPDAYFKRT
jgi:hypothetical protein